MPEIGTDILQSAITGLNLRGQALGEELGDSPALMVFLRHFGCMFCREMVKDLRAVSQRVAGYPPVIFFYQGTVAEGEAFFPPYWPEARAVSDEPKKFYTALGLRKATFTQMFGIQVWTCRLRAMSKGNFVGKAVGDPWIMPGVFLVQGGQIVWSHRFKHQGDHPEWDGIVNHVPVPQAVAR